MKILGLLAALIMSLCVSMAGTEKHKYCFLESKECFKVRDQIEMILDNVRGTAEETGTHVVLGEYENGKEAMGLQAETDNTPPAEGESVRISPTVAAAEQYTETSKVPDPSQSPADNRVPEEPVPKTEVKQPAEESTERQSAPAQVKQEKGTEEVSHVHNWTPVTEAVHHEAVTEDIWVTDQKAYDETVEKTVPVYTEVRICVASCRGCGQTFSSEDFETAVDECHSHIMAAHDNGCGYGTEQSYTESRQTGTQTVTETVHHDEVGHWETMVKAEQYDETVITGYSCTGCGITR